MAIILDGTTGITAPDITSSAGLDAADLTGTVSSARLPAGSVLQVAYSTKYDIGSYSPSAGVWVDIFSCSITPKSASSLLMVQASVMAQNTNSHLGARFVRDGLGVAVPINTGSRPVGHTGGLYNSDGNVSQNATFAIFTNSGSTANTTFTVQILRDNTASPIYVNRSTNDGDNAVGKRGVSTISIFEIAS